MRHDPGFTDAIIVTFALVNSELISDQRYVSPRAD